MKSNMKAYKYIILMWLHLLLALPASALDAGKRLSGNQLSKE
jgi:hypothetical protein